VTKSTYRPARPILGLVLLFGVMFALIGAQRMLGLALPAGGRLALAAVILIATSWLVRLYWRAIDEAAKDAQKTAWFWGASLAAIPGVVLLEVLSARRFGLSEHLQSLAPHMSQLVMGGLIIILAQLAGFLLAWAIWWAGKR